MKAESFVFAIAGMMFGVIVGWVVGSQQATGRRALTPPVPQQAAAPPPAAGSQPAPVLDQARVQALKNVADQNPRDVQPRIELGNLYFDSEHYSDAIAWYEQVMAIDPKNANVSTDLGVAYYYTNQPDRAIAQFERSLSTDPKHTKTLLNLGIVKAFGKQDLDGAAKAWEQVIALAPASPEGQAARKALDGLRNAHPQSGSGGTGGQ
jgi:cytochrome c-type biogenesis protein CcmH/NrfG